MAASEFADHTIGRSIQRRGVRIDRQGTGCRGFRVEALVTVWYAQTGDGGAVPVLFRNVWRTHDPAAPILSLRLPTEQTALVRSMRQDCKWRPDRARRDGPGAARLD